MTILKINNLNYSRDDTIIFSNLNLNVFKKDYISIIGLNRSGKTTLTKLLCAIIPSDNIFSINDIFLNKQTVLDYIEHIGVVSNSLNIFLTKKVKDELILPLKNLGYNELKIKKIINDLITFFELEDLISKNTNELTKDEATYLQIIIALVHNPEILILDDAISSLPLQLKEKILLKLKKLNEKGLTIINITSDLETIYDSNKVYLLNNKSIEELGNVEQVFQEDNYLRKLGFKIPFIIDLSIKLKFYGLLDKIYYNLEALEENLWN